MIGQDLNELIWVRGSKNPPGKVSVVVLKTEINGAEKVFVDLTQKGVDKQLELYNLSVPEKSTKSESAEVKDAEVKEVSNEAKVDSKKKEKTEVKKDE